MTDDAGPGTGLGLVGGCVGAPVDGGRVGLDLVAEPRHVQEQGQHLASDAPVVHGEAVKGWPRC